MCVRFAAIRNIQVIDICIPHYTDVDECLSGNGGCDHVCTNTQGSYTCSCLADSGLFLKEDGRSCQPCGGNLTKLTGSFSTPYWPLETYPTDMQCTWLISIAHQDVVIKLTFNETFGLAGKLPTCLNDWVEVRGGGSVDAPLLGRYCHKVVPPIIVIVGNKALVNFIAGRRHHHSRKGFKLTYEAINVTERCGRGYRLTQEETCQGKYFTQSSRLFRTVRYALTLSQPMTPYGVIMVMVSP